MNIARQTTKYEEKGFSREKAEINALMENAILAIFRDFPDAFLLFGGATLVLFHESVRHSADLDLLPRGRVDTDTRRNHQYPETRSLSYRRNSAIRRTSICDDRIGWCRGKHFRVEQLWTATLPCRPDEVRFGDRKRN